MIWISKLCILFCFRFDVERDLYQVNCWNVMFLSVIFYFVHTNICYHVFPFDYILRYGFVTPLFADSILVHYKIIITGTVLMLFDNVYERCRLCSTCYEIYFYALLLLNVWNFSGDEINYFDTIILMIFFITEILARI